MSDQRMKRTELTTHPAAMNKCNPVAGSGPSSQGENRTGTPTTIRASSLCTHRRNGSPSPVVVFVIRTWLCLVPPLVAGLDLWLCRHFFQSIHSATSWGLTLIIVTVTTTSAAISVRGCWKVLNNWVTGADASTPPPTTQA